MPTFVRCSIEGCDRNAHHSAHGAKGMCCAHYQRSRIHGDPLVLKKGPNATVKPPKRDPKVCSVEGCIRSADHADGGKLGMCSMHYTRFKKSGDPLTKGRRASPAWDWLIAHVDYDDDECLQWPFAIGENGYGRARDPATNKQHLASRVMCDLAHGKPPSRRHEAAHTCGHGNDACVNPKHLYWATPQQNHADKLRHGTSNRGERQWSARLSRDDVRSIRALASTATQAEIAMRFGVDASHINRIIHRSVWAWLD